MDRRAMVGWMGAVLLGGCGGGGGGAADAPLVSAPTGGGTSTAAAPSAAGVPLSSNIAVWGDSLTWGYAPQLQLAMRDRTIFNGGIIGDTSTQAADRQVKDTDHRDWVNVFWYGHNNQKDAPTIKADIARSVATLAPGNTHFLVLSLVNQATPDEQRGGPVYPGILQLNADLAALYPQNYVDIRSWMVGQFDPNNPQDVTDHQNDVPPSSIRWDKIHLTLDGYALVARKVKELIEARGW